MTQDRVLDALLDRIDECREQTPRERLMAAFSSAWDVTGGHLMVYEDRQPGAASALVLWASSLGLDLVVADGMVTVSGKVGTCKSITVQMAPQEE